MSSDSQSVEYHESADMSSEIEPLDFIVDVLEESGDDAGKAQTTKSNRVRQFIGPCLNTRRPYCSVAAVVFFGYIGSCFLAVAVVLRRGTTTGTTTGNKYST